VTLSGGTMDLTGGYLVVGYSGHGTFNQTGGSNSGANGANSPVGIRGVSLGLVAGSHGTYHISSSGTLSASSMVVGEYGDGDFLQEDSAQVSISSNIDIGASGGNGAYTMHGGTLTAGGITLGTESFVNTTTFTADGSSDITLGGLTASVGGTSTISLGGTAHLATTGEDIGSNYAGGAGSATFSQTGGTHTTAALTVGQQGTYNMSGGTLTVNGTFFVGSSGTSVGAVTQSGGTVDAVTLDMRGSYLLSGGTLMGGTGGGGLIHEFAGPFHWTGGQIGTSSGTQGITEVYGAGIMKIDASSDLSLVNRFLINYSTVQWTNTANILAKNGTSVENGTSGTFEIDNDKAFQGDSGSGSTFTNDNGGLVWKKSGSGVTTFDANTTFINVGTVQVDTGTVRVNGTFLGGPSGYSSTINTASGATFEAGSTGTFIISDSSGTNSGRLFKEGSGTLLINATQNHPAGSYLYADAGSTVFNTNAGSSSHHNLTLNVASGASATFNANQHLDALNVTGSTSMGTNRLMVSVATGFSDSGTIDVADGSMVLQSGTGVSTNTTNALLATGYASGAWNGSGINSRIAAVTAHRAVGTALASYALGISGTSTATWRGETVGANDVLVGYTILGDANLDGTVNFADQVAVAQHYGMSGGWQQGDFNYDGVVDFTDLVILGQNYGNSLPAPPAFAEPVGVPEPSAALVGIVCGLIAGRTRRRRRCG
jgi:hypothetical protein